MSWPLSVKEKVLVKSGRHCCICHKYCGIKIELHHITLKSEGGLETEENCIPLCFDCHADQSSYDKKHPKGTKYTEKELKGHRNKWYRICENNLGTGTNDNLDQDKETFEKLILMIPYSQTIYFLKENTLGKTRISIDDHITPLREFAETVRNPWLEFFDSDLESLRSRISDEIFLLLEGISQYTYAYPFEDEGIWMHPESFFKDYEDYHDKVKAFDKLSTQITKSYDEFVRLGRRKLGQ